MSSLEDELANLQAQLAAVQATDTAQRLSARCIIDILTLLTSGDRQGDDDDGTQAPGHGEKLHLLYSLDGKEVLTPEYLEKQIGDEILVHGGRINVVDLQQLLNVDLVHIEGRVSDMVKKDSALRIVQGELIHNTALDAMATEIDEVLQEAGLVDTADICRRFGLPTDFMLQELKKRVGTIVHGTLDKDGSTIYTSSYRTRQMAKIRGMVSGATRTVSVADIAQTLGIDRTVVQETVGELVASGRLAGNLQGKSEKAVYTPALQIRTQQRWVDNFYSKNLYIDFDAVTRLGVGNPKTYLSNKYPEGHSLVTCHVSEQLIQRLESSVEEVVESESVLDAADVLPTQLTSEDVAAAFQTIPMLYPSKKKALPSARVYDSTVVVSQALIDKVFAALQELIPKRAEAASEELKRGLRVGADSKAGSKPGTTGVSRNTSQDQAQASAAADDDDDDWNADSNKKKKKAGKKKNKSSAVPGKSKGSSRSASKAEQSDSPSFMSVEEIASFIENKFEDLKQLEGCTAAVAAELQPKLQTEFETAVQSVFKSSESSSQRKAFSTLQENLGAIVARLVLFKQGADVAEDSTREALMSHLLRTLGAQAVDVLVKAAAIEEQMQLDVTNELSADERKQILSQARASVRDELKSLQQLSQGKDVDAFMTALEKAAEGAQLYVAQLSPKEERVVAREHLEMLKAQVRQTDDPALLFHLFTSILFQQQTGFPVHAPGKCVPQLATMVQKELEEKPKKALGSLRQLARLKLTSKEASDEDSEEAPESLQDIVEELSAQF